MPTPIPVNSSWVKTIQWSNGLLSVKTKDNRVAAWAGVPESLWKQLQAAPSKGKFINDRIKGVYQEV